MENNKIPLAEVIGKTITNIYTYVKSESYGLDEAICFIELDNSIIINMPYAGVTYAHVVVWDKRKEDFLIRMSNKATFYFEASGEDTSSSIDNNHSRKESEKKNILKRIGNYISGKSGYLKPDELIHYKNEPFKSVLNRKITNYIWPEDDELMAGFFLLDNGWLITEVMMAPHGTGSVGLKVYKSIEELTEEHEEKFISLNK